MQGRNHKLVPGEKNRKNIYIDDSLVDCLAKIANTLELVAEDLNLTVKKLEELEKLHTERSYSDMVRYRD